MADEIEVEITIPDEQSDDDNNNGIPDNQETGVALERATNAADDAAEAQQDADRANETADVAVDIGIDNTQRVAQLEATVATMGSAMAQMSETLVSLRDLVAANAQATATQLEVQMRGTQPEDTAPANGHWLNRRIGV